jgi:hypothetical protein
VIAFPYSDDVMEALAMLAIFAAIYGVFGIVCAIMAPGRGRSAIGWFFIGFITQCLGIILLLLLPNLKLEEEKQRRRDEETRRLREMLKKERQVADERHDVNRTRLSVHDRALGVDTSTAEAPKLAGAPPPPLPPGPAAPPEAMWYFAQAGQQLGPVPASRLRQLFVDGEVDGKALVWREGMAQWAPITDVADLLGDGRT